MVEAEAPATDVRLHMAGFWFRGNGNAATLEPAPPLPAPPVPTAPPVPVLPPLAVAPPEPLPSPSGDVAQANPVAAPASVNISIMCLGFTCVLLVAITFYRPRPSNGKNDERRVGLV